MLYSKVILNLVAAFILLFVLIYDVHSSKLPNVAKNLIPSKGLDKLGNLVSKNIPGPAHVLDKTKDLASKATSMLDNELDKVRNFVSKAASSNGTILNCFGIPNNVFARVIEAMLTERTKAEDVRFYLYTPDQPVNVTVHADDDFHLKDLNFQEELKTVVISHGFMTSGRDEWVIRMKDAFLKLVRNVSFMFFFTIYLYIRAIRLNESFSIIYYARVRNLGVRDFCISYVIFQQNILAFRKNCITAFFLLSSKSYFNFSTSSFKYS